MLFPCHLPTTPARPRKASRSAAEQLTHTVRLFALLILLGTLSPAAAEDEGPVLPAAPKPATELSRAVMCEDIQNYAPVNPAVVFPITIGKISCLSTFNPVAEKTFVYHDWYCRDKLCKKVKLDLQPPRWSTYSSIQLREEDKGPWHVVITDPDGNIYRTLRFSITD